jgi:hypothetical protein
MNSRVPTESERFEGFEDTDIACGNPTSKTLTPAGGTLFKEKKSDLLA